MQSVGAVIDAVHRRFVASSLAYGHGTDNAWDEVVYLVLSVCGYPDHEDALALDVGDAQLAEINRIVELRLVSRQPLAHILGYTHYMGLQFTVRPGVVVPRSPLGFLLPDEIAPWQRTEVASVLDLCAGTGCLGIVAALVYPQAQVQLVELDPVACEVIAENIARHGLEERLSVIQGDVTTLPLPAADLVLCNPPYVNAVDMRSLPPEYGFEPEIGLAAGQDGLAVIAPLLARAASLIRPGGVMLGEVGASAPALIKHAPQLPFIWLDLPQGGEGVFLLEADALSSHTARQN